MFTRSEKIYIYTACCLCLSRGQGITATTLSISSPPSDLEWTAALSSLSLWSTEDRAPRRHDIFVVHMVNLKKPVKSNEELRLDISSMHRDIPFHELPLMCHISSWMKPSPMPSGEARWGEWRGSASHPGSGLGTSAAVTPHLRPSGGGFGGVRGTLRAAHSNPRALFLHADCEQRAVISLYWARGIGFP